MSSDRDRFGRAGDYVMGRMAPAERERAELDLERDPQFREAVLRLSERIRRNDTVAEAELWRSVATGLSSLPQMRAAVPPSPASSRKDRRTTDRATGASHPLSGWKGALLVAGIAAACGASYIAGDSRARLASPDLIVTLKDQGGGIGGFLEVGGDDMLRFVPLALDAAPQGEALQLWTIYDDGIGPVPLGAVLPDGATRWRGPDLPLARPGQRYRVTVGDGKAPMSEASAVLEGSAMAVGGR
jgi:anti-sigma-K factor RskA